MFFRFLIGSVVSGLLILLGYYFMGDFLLGDKLTEEELDTLNINSHTSEYQIYKSPRLPSVQSLSDDCENLATNLLRTVEKNNYCQLDTDCKTLPFYGYPLGTYNLVNSNKFEDSVKAINVFKDQKNKWQCVYPLYQMLENSKFKLTCKKQKCKYENIRPKLPRLSTFLSLPRRA